MTTISDVFDQLKQANSTLATIHDDLLGAIQKSNAEIDAVNATIQGGITVMENGFLAVVQQQKLGNLIAAHLTQQVDTVICILEKISKNTCASVNEETAQTQLDKDLLGAVKAIEFIAASAQPSAALELDRARELQRKLDECCKKEAPAPPCNYAPCPKPDPLGLPGSDTPPR